MKITGITYGRLRSLPGFNNERIEITAELHQTEPADEVLANLEEWVNTKLGADPVKRRPPKTAREKEIRDRLQVLHGEMGQLEAELEAYQAEELPF